MLDTVGGEDTTKIAGLVMKSAMTARHRRFQGGWNRRTATRVTWLFAAWLLVVAAMVAVPTAAAAQTTGPATYVVDSTATGGGDCATAGSCTLRAAVDAANANAGSAVEIPAGTYVIDGQLAISAPMTIQGAAGQGAEATVIDAAGGSRVFDIQSIGVTISGVTVTGGDVNQTGGGIRIGAGDELTLVDSRVTGNTAREGGGIDNSGTLVMLTSTVDANTADRKGGGIRNNGVGTIDNSTIAGNTANQGGGLSSPGETTVTHATIVRNVATSSSSAGVDRNGGTLTIAYSVIAENFRGGGSEASDCSGTPDLVSLNLVSDTQGCNPVGPVLVDPAPGLGALADNGGPTPTIEVLDVNGAGEPNPILDAIDAASCVFSFDQRGSARPIGAGCELGAFEVAPLEVTFDLDVDPLSYASIDDPSTPGPEVEVGVITVPTADILEELVTRSEDPATEGPADAALRSIALRSIALRSIALRSIDPESAALRSIALRSIALRSIALRSIALRSIALRSIALRSILVSDVPLEEEGGWDAALTGTPLEGLPLQSITIEDVFDPANGVSTAVTDAITLEDITIEASALRSIALRSIVLAGAALRSIEVVDPDTGDLIPTTDPAALDQAWCDILSDVCPTEISAADLGGLDLLDVQLAGGDVDQVPLFDIPVASALRSIALRSIALRSIGIERSALRSIALRSIALRSIGDLGAIVDCSGFPEYCSTDETNTFTLGDVPDAALIGTLEDLGQLDDDLLEGVSLGDLLLAFLPPDGIQWESINLDGALLQNLPLVDDRQPVFEYVATVEVTGGPGDLDLTVTLPTGFAAARGDGDPSATFDGAPVNPVDESLSQVQFLIDNVPNGIHELRIPARAGLVTGGPFTAVGQVIGSSGGEVLSTPPVDMADVWVVEAFEEDSPGSPIPLLTDGELQLAHISRADDVDLYAFTVPAGAAGAKARIRLSNIPAGVDYDLAVYQAEPTPLRGAPTQTLDSLGDIGYDLDPSDDVYETDLAGDIPLNVTGDRGIPGFTVRDISTKRSQEDEEVGTGPLEAGGIYYIAVSSYLDGLSPNPYGLRVQLQDAPALPDCAGPRALPTASPMVQAPIGADVNTLYITNTQWLAADLATTAGGVTLQQITDAITATAGVNGVVPALVPVDGYPGIEALYTTWATSGRCDVDARNAIVSAIGDIIDDISATRSIENIVIVGGDGVVPQAAVDDLTEFSNEDTFALETVQNNENNEIAAALGASKLLSDDPYATAAGIAIRNGDHELFVQETVIGRLVETGEQILGQLTNFVTYGGELDPATLPGGTTPGNATATVTGYDFLSDGAQALAAELAAAGTVDTSLISETWDDVALLNLLDGADNTVLSVNAHYDFESLLPAAFDGTPFTADDLVITDEIDASDGDGIGVPDFTAIVTAGCHAGLSMHDVQLGFNTLDWAETFSRGDNNVFAAHTTYGFGDTEAVAYSERLIEIFGRNLAALTNGDPGAPASIGAAMRDAKQEYLATTLVLTPYDEKILQSMTFYGMPMFVVGSDPVVAPLAAPAAVEAEVDDGITIGDADGAGIRRVDVELTTTVGTPGPGNLNLNATDLGNYYDVNGQTVGAQYRALQPLVDIPLPDSGTPAAGFLITDLVASDFADFTPYYLQPTLDSSANESAIVPADGSFPASLQRVSTQANGQQRLLLAAGQFQDGLDGGLDLQRVFPTIGGDLYPENGVVADEPIFTRVIGRSGEFESVVQFEIETSAPVQRVYVLFKEQSQLVGAWRGLDLFNVAGTNTWLGAAPVSGPNVVVEFFGQLVGLDNTVRITDNKVDNFLASVPDEVGELVIDLTGLDVDPDDGYFNGPVTATVDPASSGDPDTIELSVDSQPFVLEQSTEISTEGGHVVLARDGAGGREFVFFVIDSIAPTVSADVSPTGEIVSGQVTVTISATDTGQAGVASITYSATGAETIAETTVDADNVSFPIAADGDTTVTFFATDAAGNAAEAQTVDITIDTVAPSVSAAVIDPVPAPTSGWYTEDVTVRVTAEDAGTGITGITVDGTVTPVDPAAASASVDEVVTAEGETTIAFSAVDAGSNPASGSITVSIDKTAPDLTVTPSIPVSGYVGESVTVTLAATDDAEGILTSGLASITYSATGADAIVETVDTTGEVDVLIDADGVTVLTVVATDVAGNSTTPQELTVSIDTAGPTVSAAVVDPTPAPTSGWYTGDVTVRVTASDPLSGAASITIDGTETAVGPSASESLDTIVSAQGSTTVTFGAADVVGNTATPGSITVQIDSQAPTIGSISIDTDFSGGDPNDTNGNGLFDLGESVSVTYSCSDSTSGMAAGGCELSLDGVVVDSSTSGGTVSVATSAIGDNVFTVDAADVAGNTASAAQTLLVPYAICLEYDPTQAKNIGSNYTIQFQICDLDGTNLSARRITLTAVSVDGVIAPGPNDSGNANNQFVARYSNGARRYTYNLDTTGFEVIGSGLHYLWFEIELQNGDSGGVVAAPFTLN